MMRYKGSGGQILEFTILVASVFVTLPQSRAAVVTLDSSGAVTLLDSGLSTTDFPAPFTAANFSAAQTGRTASVLTSTPSYIASLPHGPGAVWIGTNATAGVGTGNTALYAISFNIPGTVSSASLNLYYAVDNILGETNAGIYINGTALPNSTGLLCSLCLSSFDHENNYTDANIGPLLVAGTNWLYFDGVNQGGPAGLIFSAVINTSPSSGVPEPGSLLLAVVGLLGAGMAGLRRGIRPRRRAAVFERRDTSFQRGDGFAQMR